MPKGYKVVSEAQRTALFWSKVRISDDLDACWPWQAYRNPKGYGQFHWDGRMHTAHRIAFFVSGSLVPHGMDVCHTCDNPSCCNPKHLFAGTRKENVADSVAKGRFIRGEKMGRSKLKTAEVLAMRKAWQEGTHWRDLAAQYGIDRSYARKVVLGKTWKHLT